MYFRFDANKWALHQLPPLLRRTRIYALLRCLMTGIRELHETFTAWRAERVRQLGYNGHTAYIARFLNDLFSLDDEIYIEDYRSPNVYLHYAEETPEEVYMCFQDEGESLFLSSRSPEDVAGGFTVMVPASLATEENIVTIRKWVEYYRAAGTVYRIETYE